MTLTCANSLNRCHSIVPNEMNGMIVIYPLTCYLSCCRPRVHINQLEIVLEIEEVVVQN